MMKVLIEGKSRFTPIFINKKEGKGNFWFTSMITKKIKMLRF